MRQTTEQNERMTRYLLGDLPETEQAVVEEEYFADTEKFEEVWEAENDLVDRYVRGRLSRVERKLFERNYLQSPKHRDRVAMSRKLLEAADSRSVAPQIAAPAPSRFIDALKTLLTPRILAPAAAFLLLFSVSSWLLIERARLNREIGNAQARLSDQERREREIADQLAAEREQGAELKSRLDRLLESLSEKPSLAPPSILPFLLAPTMTGRDESEPHQQITIPRETDMVQLQIKNEKAGSRGFQATIQRVGGSQIWSQKSLKPAAGIITVKVPADKFIMDDYILTLSATTPTGETVEIKTCVFRVIRR